MNNIMYINTSKHTTALSILHVLHWITLQSHFFDWNKYFYNINKYAQNKWYRSIFSRKYKEIKKSLPNEYKIFFWYPIFSTELMNRVLFKRIKNHIFSWMHEIFIEIKLIQNKARLHPSITKPTKGKTKIDE